MTNRIKKLPIDYNYDLYKMHGDEYAIVMDLQDNKNDSTMKTINNIVIFLFEEINDKSFKYKGNEINVRITIRIVDYNSIFNDSKVIQKIKF